LCGFVPVDGSWGSFEVMAWGEPFFFWWAKKETKNPTLGLRSLNP
jgi:hypothetical protein